LSDEDQVEQESRCADGDAPNGQAYDSDYRTGDTITRESGCAFATQGVARFSMRDERTERAQSFLLSILDLLFVVVPQMRSDQMESRE
jgi:hypothetical protein